MTDSSYENKQAHAAAFHLMRELAKKKTDPKAEADIRTALAVRQARKNGRYYVISRETGKLVRG